MTAIPTKMQTWGDDLRLPSLQPTETMTLLASLEQDRRIAMPFQSKHLAALKRNTWFALKRPSDRSRTGLLVIWPEHKACVYVQGGPGNPRVALLRLRVDSQFVSPAAGLTVFAATLSPAARGLWIEDVIQWKGARVQEQKSFTQRWALVQQWLNHYYSPDPRLVAGIELAPASWMPLDAVKPEGSWDFQQDTAGQKRLYWLADKIADSTSVTPISKKSQWQGKQQATTPLPIQKVIGPLIAIAIKEAGPDQWSLAAVDGILLGRALIRRFQVSSDLRSAGGRPHVEVRWIPEFEKWEIVSLSSANTASSGANFAASK